MNPIWRIVILVLAVICFAGAAIANREAGNWFWLIPAGLAGFAFAHIDWPGTRT